METISASIDVKTTHRPFLTAATYTTAASIAGSFPGFLIPIATAAAIGADARTDAFFLALSAASLLAAATGATTQQAAIPFLIAARRRGEDIRRFLGEITSILLLLAALPTVVVNCGVLLFIQHQAVWSTGETRLFVTFLWLLLPYLAMSVVAGVYSGSLNAEHRFARAAFSPALRSGIVLAGIAIAPWVGLFALVGGYVLGEFIRLLYLLAPVRRAQGVTLLALPKSPGAREFWRTAMTQMLGSGILAVLPVIDRAMASQLAPGSVTVFEYADRMWQVPIGLVMSGFLVTSLAHWSERLQSGGSLRGLSRDTVRASGWLLLVSLPLALSIALYRQPLVNVIFASGRLSIEEYARLADVFAMFVTAMPVYLAGLVYTRAFLILKRSDWLVGINVVQFATKIVCNLIFIRTLGLTGLAASTAVMYVVSTCLLVLLFHTVIVKAPVPANEFSDRAAI